MVKKIAGRIFSMSLFFIMLMAFPLVSSLEFDNRGNYERNTQTMIIKNAFGLGSAIAELTLNTPVEYEVAVGYQKVAEFTINNFEDYNDALRTMKFYDKRNELNELQRSFDYKVKTIINVSVDDYRSECIKFGNGTVQSCERVVSGSHQEQRVAWGDLGSQDLTRGIITIGLFTNVQIGDQVEWIPTFYGVEIAEWAVWTQSLNVNIRTYWKLNESSGTLVDSLGQINLTAIGSPSFDETGIIAGAIGINAELEGFTNSSLSNLTAIDFGTTEDFSANLWVNFTSNSVGFPLLFDSNSLDDPRWAIFGANGNTLVSWRTTTAGGGVTLTTDGDLGINNTFHMITLVRNNSGADFFLFIDGIINQSLTGETPQDASSGNVSLGNPFASRVLNANIDEFSIWGRALDGSEITQLFNSGAGITYINEVPPTVTLNSPVDNFNSSNSIVTFNATAMAIAGANLTNMTLYTNKSGSFAPTNITVTTDITNTEIWNNSFTDGNFVWNVEACDDRGDCSFATSNRTFIVDTVFTQIDVEAPVGVLGFGVLGDEEVLNVTFTDALLDQCWFDYNGTNVSIEGCITGIKNSTTFILEANNFNITVYANDTSGNLNSTVTTWSYLSFQLNQTFESTITEGELNDFSILLNISDGSSLDSAVFTYNGTNFSTSIVFSSGLFLITSTIISPTLDADTNFTFNFNIVVDGLDNATASTNQTVINSLFDICGGISNDTLLNMSLFDEGTLLPLSGDIEISASVISQSSGASVGTINKTFENVQFGAICFSPVSSYPLYFLDAEIRYESDGYAAEFYNIRQADMADFPVNLSLFDLNLNDSTEFAVTYKNNAFIFTEGAIIQLQRNYIGDNVFRVVEAPVTGNGGQAVLHIDLNTHVYRASVVKDGELLDFFENIVFSCENELSGECTHTLDGTVNPNNDIPIEELTDFSYAVSIDEDNQTVTVLFAVPSGTPSTINVVLGQIDMFGNLTSCNTTVITSAGSITCGYVDTIEKSLLELSISKDDVQLVVLTFANDPELDMDGMNFFFVFLFMISLVGMAIASPEWMIIISVLVLMISGMMLLVQGMSLVMGLGAIAWLLVAAAIIIMKMSKQEDR